MSAVRQHQSDFGVHAASELADLFHCFGLDLSELRKAALHATGFDRPVDECVIQLVASALRSASGDPFSIFNTVDPEILRLRRDIAESQHRPAPQFERRGRGAGWPPNTHTGGRGAAGGAQPRPT